MTGADLDHENPPDPPPVAGFPGEHSLCENCGYPLRGCRVDQRCPECGRSIGESDPTHRCGLPWQARIGLLPWLETLQMIVFRPRDSFRLLRVDRPDRNQNRSDRLFMITIAAGIGLLWTVTWRLAGLGLVWQWGLLVAGMVIMMTYVEVIGVAYFSKKRGWRVPLALAERVGCYCVVGWVPAVVIFEAVYLLDQTGTLARYWPAGWGPWDLRTRLFVLALVWGGSIMSFEYLVWLGIRKVKYANYTDRPSTDITGECGQQDFKR